MKYRADGKLNWWIIPAFFYVFHGLAVAVFGMNSADLTGPNADAGSMIWIVWVLIDFPIGFVALMIADDASSNAIAVLLVALIGGIQWILWGLGLTGVIRWLQGR